MQPSDADKSAHKQWSKSAGVLNLLKDSIPNEFGTPASSTQNLCALLFFSTKEQEQPGEGLDRYCNTRVPCLQFT